MNSYNTLDANSANDHEQAANSSASTSREIRSKKRPYSATEEPGPSSLEKIPKIHPFFTTSLKFENTGPFQWLQSLGPASSCLHAINMLPQGSAKIAAFDLDGTLIKSNLKAKANGGLPEWEWWSPLIPQKLQELHSSGYALVIISNQAIKPLALKTWKQKVTMIASALNGLPFRLMAAIAKDQYRKPMPGMWYELETISEGKGITIDKGQSFFVGDAAGRVFSKSRDFASTDRKWASNVGIPFFTPEEFFLQLPTHDKFVMPGFHASSLPELPVVLPSSSSLLPNPQTQEIVLLVGPPSIGKTTFFRRHFSSADYLHVNQDNLKTKARCVRAASHAIQQGKSCVIDNTNRNSETRMHYIDVAKAHQIPIRCFEFTGSIDLAWHNNLYRAFMTLGNSEPKRDLVPYGAFASFYDQYEEPQLTEGFAEIKRINWLFQGSDEERRRWSMWLQIDGK